MLVAIIIYLSISVMLAISTIKKMIREENYLQNVPAGDLCMYRRRTKMVNTTNIVFFPSIIIGYGYCFVVRTINSILY